MVKKIILLKSLQFGISFSVHNQGQISKTISKNKACLTHISITVVKLTFIYYVWVHVHSWNISLLNCFYFSTAV